MAFAELGETERAWELFSLLNPIHHATDPAQVNRYKAEPYVVVADIYSVAPHTGRGGWSWYTGSAGWMYRLIVETLLGLRLEAGELRVSPRLPRAWESLKLHYRHRDTFYHITVKRDGVAAAQPVCVIVDGKEQPDATIQLVDDREEHAVEINIR
jgi:cellobiose phosphorylase